MDQRRDVTYLKFVCMVRTEKAEPNRTKATMGGNLINYPEDVDTPTATVIYQDIFQQCHFNGWNKICNSRHIKFLPDDTTKAAREHQSETVQHSQRNNLRIQPF